MKFIFHPEVRAEFLSAIDYYEDCRLGLDYGFAFEVQAAIEDSCSFPDATDKKTGLSQLPRTAKAP